MCLLPVKHVSSTLQSVGQLCQEMIRPGGVPQPMTRAASGGLSQLPVSLDIPATLFCRTPVEACAMMGIYRQGLCRDWVPPWLPHLLLIQCCNLFESESLPQALLGRNPTSDWMERPSLSPSENMSLVPALHLCLIVPEIGNYLVL